MHRFSKLWMDLCVENGVKHPRSFTFENHSLVHRSRLLFYTRNLKKYKKKTHKFILFSFLFFSLSLSLFSE